MKKKILSILPILFLIGGCSFLSAQKTHKLTVTVKNIESSRGNICVGIYNRAQGAFEMQNSYKGVREPARQGTMTFEFELEPGRYAVGVIHDANKNNALDKNLLGIPKEDYGFSNGARRPVFDDAAFNFQSDMKLSISL